VPNLAKLEEKFHIGYRYQRAVNGSEYKDGLALTWQEILKIVGPYFRKLSNTATVDNALRQYLREVIGKSHYRVRFSMTDKETILNQLELLGFIKSEVYNLQNGGQGLFYQLTPGGVAEALRLNAVTSEGELAEPVARKVD
jgi:hypothetical protein